MISYGGGMTAVAPDAVELRDWLFGRALPLWWRVGADRTRGGFHEAIDLDGKPVARPHRARTIARQAFSYCEAGRLGWNGPWREAAQHALDYFRKHFILNDDTVLSVVDLDGTCREPRFDLYDQAFALLAYASAHRAFGHTAGWDRRASALRNTLERHFADGFGGFLPGRDGRLPQSANPHMHLLEAALAWMELDSSPPWRTMAEGIVALCLEKMIEPRTGALREFFTADWMTAPGVGGATCDPGHHYEWAFLLDRWARLIDREKLKPAERLIAFADAHGLDSRRDVVVNAVLTDGALKDPTGRLWAQAERIRAYIAVGRGRDEVASAIRALWRFLATPTPGLWFDQLDENNNFVIEPARATQLYHIVGAVAELFPIAPKVTSADRRRRGLQRRRVLYLVTEDWYFISHRLPMARAAQQAGFEVHVATRVDRHGEAIEAEGFHLHPVSWRRGSLDPRDLFRVVREVRQLYRKLKPDLAHHVALPATVVGSLAATGMPIICLNAMTGLGTIFISTALKVRAARMVLRPALRTLLNRAGAAVLVQNLDDRGLIEKLGVDPARIALIPGSGVDTDVMVRAPEPEPTGPVTVAFVGRLVEAKGIRTLVKAHRRLHARGRDIRLLIAGLPDPANPSSIPSDEIGRWAQEPNLSYLGFVEDTAALWARAHIAVLPSRREGLPLSLLEAAACGRPIVATDVPGCRAIARPDLNALLVPVDDVQALADAIDRLALDPALRQRFGEASRQLAEGEFSARRIGQELIALYRHLLEPEAVIARAKPSV